MCRTAGQDSGKALLVTSPFSQRYAYERIFDWMLSCLGSAVFWPFPEDDLVRRPILCTHTDILDAAKTLAIDGLVTNLKERIARILAGERDDRDPGAIYRGPDHYAKWRFHVVSSIARALHEHHSSKRVKSYHFCYPATELRVI
jgi:hypothetical protein